MKVILLTKITGLGDIDDVVEVSDGYAVNYLFPKHLAVLASSKNVDQVLSSQTRKQKQNEKKLKEEQILANKLEGLFLTIKEKTNEVGSFYAVINTQKISQRLKKLGFNINKNQIHLTESIKQPGEYKIKIKLQFNLETIIHLLAEVE